VFPRSLLAWKSCELASDIETHLCDLGAKVAHVGSTAVPGLEAKPILDLPVGLADQQGIDEAALRLSAIGWPDLGEAGVAGRRYLRFVAPFLPTFISC
jgi:GrpB-like predicted nucleotidyltransferase (UPF0157 family)